MKRFVVPGIVLVLAGAMAYWWFENFERVDTEVHVGLPDKTRADPYLAFKRLIVATGRRFEETPAGATPGAAIAALPAGGTLVMLARREVLMTPARVGALMAWVEAGGHLIAAAEPLARPDPLLAAANLGRTALKPPAAARPGAGAGAGAAARDTPVRASFPGRDRTLSIAIGAPLVITDQRGAADWRVDDARGTRLLSLPRGKGRVTVAADLGWIAFRGAGTSRDPDWQPIHIGRFDHAEAIVAMIDLAPQRPAAAVRLMGGTSSLSLVDWLATHAWPALAGLALVLILWLWRVVPRFGPVEAALPVGDERFATHLEASGRFYRRHLPIEEIHAGLRRRFLKRLAERRPGLAARAPGMRNQELGRLAGVRADRVARALDGTCRGSADFTAVAAILWRLDQVI
ncbi:MAG: DUF4350 domain-containing protein [Burkholderiales bacterium]|nr:DUF4350 domain-containing protein [Burkholderiales bacterium]